MIPQYPYIIDCKVPKENYRCYDNQVYPKCIIYQRYKQLGYDVEHDDLGLGAIVKEKTFPKEPY